VHVFDDNSHFDTMTKSSATSKSIRNRTSYHSVPSVENDEELGHDVEPASTRNRGGSNGNWRFNAAGFLSLLSLVLLGGLGFVSNKMSTQIVDLKSEIALDEDNLDHLRTKVQNQDIVIQRFNGRFYFTQ
jgi:hypothetical protein